jgi:hypothetical protein
MRVARMAVVLCVMLGSAIVAASCGGGLATSCSEYVKDDEKTQLKLAAQWASPSRDGKVSTLETIVAPDYRERLIGYCSYSGHGDDKLEDLDLMLR